MEGLYLAKSCENGVCYQQLQLCLYVLEPFYLKIENGKVDKEKLNKRKYKGLVVDLRQPFHFRFSNKEVLKKEDY